MKTTNGFQAMSDRYRFDFKLCTAAKGWAQLDTRQDAWYFSNWINPLTREFFSYCEGDLTHTECADDAEFTAHLRETLDWHRSRDYLLGIDPMNNDEIKAAFERLGFGNELH